MGHLFVIQRGGMGIAGDSKGDSYARGGGGMAPPAVAPMDPAKTAAVLNQINTINAGDGGPQRMTATGETLPSTKTAEALPRRYPLPPPLSPPVSNIPVHIIPSWVPVPTGVVPVMPDGGGGGGGGGAAPGGEEAAAAAADPPVFLGLTKKQLVIGGLLVGAGWLLLRKKKHGSSAAAGGVL